MQGDRARSGAGMNQPHYHAYQEGTGGRWEGDAKDCPICAKSRVPWTTGTDGGKYPWKVVEDGPNQTPVIMCSYQQICKLKDTLGKGTIRANARLIAAAPELYRTLANVEAILQLAMSGTLINWLGVKQDIAAALDLAVNDPSLPASAQFVDPTRP